MRRTLAVIAEEPPASRAGTVRRHGVRPARGVGIRESQLLDTLEKAAAVPDAELVVSYFPDGALPFFREALPGARVYAAQRSTDRLEEFRELFSEFCDHGTAVVVVDADLPIVHAYGLELAFDALTAGRTDLVFGFSEAGELYLAGMTACHSELLSEPFSANQAIQRAARMGLGWYMLPESAGAHG